MARLILTSAQGSFALRDSENLVGSHRYCQVCLGGRGIAGEHARIDVDGDQVTITPLVDGLSTFLDGERINGPRILRPGNRITIGGVDLSLTDDLSRLAPPRLSLMRRALGGLKVAAFLLALVVFAAYLLLRVLFNEESVRARVLSALDASLRRISSVGECEVHLIGGAVVIRDLRIENKPDFQRHDFLHVKEVRIEFPWMSALSSVLDERPEIRLKVRVFVEEIFIERNARGDLNLANLLRTLPGTDVTWRQFLDGAPIDPAVKDLGLDVRVDIAAIRFHDGQTGANLEASATLEASLASLDGPLEYTLTIESDTGRGKSRVVVKGRPHVFHNGRIVASGIRGNLAYVAGPSLDAAALGRLIPQLAICDRMDVQLDLGADGLDKVTGWLRAALRDLHVFGAPLRGVDGLVSAQVAVDLVRGNVTVNAPEDVTPALSLTHRPETGAPEEHLGTLHAYARVRHAGFEELASRFHATLDLSRPVVNRVLRDRGWRAPVAGSLELELETGGGLLSGMPLTLRSAGVIEPGTATRNGTETRYPGMRYRAHLESLVRLTAGGRLSGFELTRADVRVERTGPDSAKAPPILELRLPGDRPLRLRGLDRPDRPIDAEGGLDIRVSGDQLARWMEEVLGVEDLPREDATLTFTLAEQPDAGRFAAPFELRLDPRWPGATAEQGLVIDGRAQFDLGRSVHTASMRLRDGTGRYADQDVRVTWEQFSAVNGALTVRTNPHGSILLHAAPLMKRFAPYLRRIAPFDLDGELLLEGDARVRWTPAKRTLDVNLAGRAPAVTLSARKTDDAAPPVARFDVSNVQFKGAFDLDTGAASIPVAKFVSAPLDVEFSATLTDAVRYLGSAQVSVRVKDQKRAVRILQVLRVMDGRHEPSDGRFAMEMSVESTDKGVTVGLKTLELDAKMGELRLAAPTSLRTGPLATALLSGRLPVDGQVPLRGRLGSLTDLGGFLRGLGMPAGLILEGAGRPGALAVTLNLEGLTVEADVRLSDLPETATIGCRLSDGVAFTIEKSASARLHADVRRPVLRVDAIKAGVYGGELTGAFTVAMRGERWSITAGEGREIALRGVNLDRLLERAWGVPGSLSGVLDARVTFEGRGLRPADFASAWTATVLLNAEKLSVQTAQMSNLPLFNLIQGVDRHLFAHPRLRDRVGAGLSLLGSAESMAFEPVRGVRLEMANGRVRFSDLTLHAPGRLHATFSGFIGLDGEVDVQMRLHDVAALASIPAAQTALRTYLLERFHEGIRFRGRLQKTEAMLKEALDALALKAP